MLCSEVSIDCILDRPTQYNICFGRMDRIFGRHE